MSAGVLFPGHGTMIRLTSHDRNGAPMDPTHGETGGRFLLWVDAVGGYLVCLGDEVVLGQPIPAGRVDVPLLGDVSGRHAKIRRDSEGYLIEALRDVKVNGRTVHQAALLTDGARIQLGDSVRLLFRRPLALSATARLEFLSRHRTHPSTDAVVLMADACVLGPKPHSHVVCRDWSREVVLFRHEGQLYCRFAGEFQIDGLRHCERGQIHRNARIAGADFSLSLEAI
jgi:hypothetical protein